MHQSLFFKLFPPPKFLLMPHVGIDISDDAISFIEYSRPVGDRTITKHGTVNLDVGIIEGGDIKDEAKLLEILSTIVRDNNLLYAKLSIPEEKAYLFETEIPYGDLKLISQNIEFKLEENIPLSAADVIFTFDLLPNEHNKPWRASVFAVPRTYIEHMVEMFRKVGIIPVAFETAPRAIARVVSGLGQGNVIVIHVLHRKTGVYVITDNAVGFTSTISIGYSEANIGLYTDSLATEIHRVCSFWLNQNQDEFSAIHKVVVVGHDAENVVLNLRDKVSDTVSVEVIDVWHSVLDMTKYVPPIDRDGSFEYAPAAGLAL